MCAPSDRIRVPTGSAGASREEYPPSGNRATPVPEKAPRIAGSTPPGPRTDGERMSNSTPPASAPQESSDAARPRTPGTGLRYLLLMLAAAAVVAVGPIAGWFAPVAGPSDPVDRPSPEIEMYARFGMALKAVDAERFSGSFASELDRETASEEGADADALLAQGVEDLRAAIALGEIDGAERAVERVRGVVALADDLDPEDPRTVALLRDASVLTAIYVTGPESVGESDRERLVERHGDLGRIALAFGLPDDAPAREPLARSAVRMVVGFGALGVLVLAAMAVGLVLMVVGIVLAATGRLRMRYQPDLSSDARTHHAFIDTAIVFLAAFAAFKALLLGASIAFPDAEGALAWAQLVGPWVLAGLVFWPLVRGVKRATAFRSMGWVRGRGVMVEMGCGVMAYLAFLPVVAVGLVLLVVLMQVFGLHPSHPAVERLQDASWAEVVLVALMAAVWAPLVEESIFRGALFHHARRFVGWVVAALLTAFVFAAIHPQGIATIPALMALAIGFAFAREWRGSLIGPVTAHAMHNATLVALNLVLFA